MSHCKVIQFMPQDDMPKLKLEPLSFKGCTCTDEHELLSKICDGVRMYALPELDKAVDMQIRGVNSSWVLVEMVREYLKGMADYLENRVLKDG